MVWQKTGRVLVVGLGNPGNRYAGTRHNIGFMLADALAASAGFPLSREKFSAYYGTGQWQGRQVVILKPQTFMNLSGRAVARALSFFDLDTANTVVFHDDVDLPWGDVRVKVGGGHGGHNGLRSIIQDTGNKDFVRIRLGIGRPAVGDVTGHVLGRFTDLERAEGQDVLDIGLKGLELLFDESPKAAMNAINGLYRAKSEGVDSV